MSWRDVFLYPGMLVMVECKNRSFVHRVEKRLRRHPRVFGILPHFCNNLHKWEDKHSVSGRNETVTHLVG